MLQGIVNGAMSFDDYVCALGENPPSAQIQLRAANDQRRVANWNKEDFERIRDGIRAEFDLNFQQQRKPVAPPPRMFNPFAAEGKITIPEGLEITRLPSSMGKAEKRSSSDTDMSNPTRTKGGTFRPDVAEVWFISPTTGHIKRRMFVSGDDAIAEAFRFANEISNESAEQPSALVKFRAGQLKGNRWVYICTPDGYLVTPQTVMVWHGQNSNSKVALGEKTSKLSLKIIRAMLEQNAYIRKAFGSYLDENGTLKVSGGVGIDVPTLEPADPKELTFRVQFVSTTIREVNARPKTSVKDADGKVILPGHKRRAYDILLSTEGEGADQPKNVKYTFEGKVYVVLRSEALHWAESKETQDEDALEALLWAYEEGHLDSEEYFERVATFKYDRDNPGRRQAQARYQAQLLQAVNDGVITGDSFDFMSRLTHPSHRDQRSGPTMWERKTRVQFGKDGRMIWQRAKNDDTPGARWVGNMNVHEAQIYNL